MNPSRQKTTGTQRDPSREIVRPTKLLKARLCPPLANIDYSTATADKVKHALAKVAKRAAVAAKVIDIATARHR